MKNITIKENHNCSNLDRKINLKDGAIVVQKENENVIAVYLVIPFRDGKHKYGGDSSSGYCSLVNLDNGKISFEERCCRATTERRVLRHLTRAGFTYPYDPNSHEQDGKFCNMRVQVYNNGNYRINLELGKEYILN